MKYILYYSNYCDHCKELLMILAKEKIGQKEISYICIDNRKSMNGKMYAVLNTGKMIMIPNNIKEVPSLLLLNHGNSVMVGKKIIEHFKKSERTTLMEQPEAFSFSEIGTMSDSFSYLDSTPEEMMAKGNGGLRNMHGFVSLDHIDKIETPPEEEEDTSRSVDMDSVMKKRTQEINLNN